MRSVKNLNIAISNQKFSFAKSNRFSKIKLLITKKLK